MPFVVCVRAAHNTADKRIRRFKYERRTRRTRRRRRRKRTERERERERERKTQIYRRKIKRSERMKELKKKREKELLALRLLRSLTRPGRQQCRRRRCGRNFLSIRRRRVATLDPLLLLLFSTCLMLCWLSCVGCFNSSFLCERHQWSCHKTI